MAHNYHLIANELLTIAAAIQFSSHTTTIMIVRLGIKSDVASLDVGF